MEYFSYRENIPKEDYIGFLGAMNVAHNENAVRHFISDILPQIVKEIPEAKFLVIGAGVSEDLRKLESDHVFFTGRVEDVRDYLKKCKVFVCPMTFGSGIKTKNLEAMSMGLPVVTTTIGAENINVVNSQECFISDENHDFADKVINIIQNDNLALQIGSNAASYIRKYWTWEDAEVKFSKILTKK